MPNDLIDRVTHAYGLDVAEHLPMQSGYRNKNYPLVLAGGERVNLIFYKQEPGIRTTIQNADRLSNFLHEHGLPARWSFDTRILKLSASTHLQYAGLYYYLPGETISWEAYTMKHLKSLGTAMSTMHATLANEPKLKLPTIEQTHVALLERMRAYFTDAQVQIAMQNKLGITLPTDILALPNALLSAAPHFSNKQPLHMDFVRSNILFAPGTPTICGMLDFEKAAYGSPVFDIARTLAFLYVDCKYKELAKIRKYFFYSGYRKYGAATYQPVHFRVNGTSYNALEIAISFYLLHDFYKFLRHNPYESLHENEHYTRTVQLLIDRKVL